MPKITSHANKRIKQRIGIPKKSAHTNAEKALIYGVSHKDTSGTLCRYSAGNIKIYNDFVYIFCVETLITVFSLPKCYIPAARKIQVRINNIYSV